MSGHLSTRAEALRAIAEGLRQAAEGLVRLAGASPQNPTCDVYTSEHRPAGMSRRRFATRCRELARHGVAGVTRAGRVWSAPSTAFDNPRPIAVAARADSLRPRSHSASAWSAEQALRDAGARQGAIDD